MTPARRIKAFATLGDELRSMSPMERHHLAQDAVRYNPWFTPESVSTAIDGIGQFLTVDALEKWTSSYMLDRQTTKTIGVVMAGNIPLVGFHDLLCVLISGNRLKGKLSSQDPFLPVYLASRLQNIEPGFGPLINWAERLDQIDAVIATGSDNSSRYFEYYFRQIPRIIRKNRSSCAVLSGSETNEELTKLGIDVFTYFGLGCRNVSQLFLPLNFDLNLFPIAWREFGSVINLSRYINNYDHQKAILLVNRVPFYDTGYVLLKEDASLVSPVSVLHFTYYLNTLDLQQKLAAQIDRLQCVVSSKRWLPGSLGFGDAQFPDVSDYADGIDTLRFLSQLQ